MGKVEYTWTYHLGKTISRKHCESCGVKVRYFAGHWLDVITDDTSRPCRVWKDGTFLCHACCVRKLGTPLRKRTKKIILYGIPVSRFKELINLFNDNGYNLKSEEDWKSVKLKFFEVIENE